MQLWDEREVAVAPDRDAERLHHVFMSLIRLAGVALPDQVVPGQSMSLSKMFALHELDTDTGLSQRELGERLHLEKSTVSRLAAELERAGLLVRERDPGNRRLYRLRLTPQGREMHAAVGAAFHERYERWVAQMTPGEVDALLVGLPAFIRIAARELDPNQTTEHAPEAP